MVLKDKSWAAVDGQHDFDVTISLFQYLLRFNSGEECCRQARELPHKVSGVE